MKSLLVIITIFFSTLTLSQSKNFIYEYRFVSDSTNKNDVKTEMMILNINDEKSVFYSAEAMHSDSTLIADSKKGLMTMPPNKKLIRYRVTKNKNSESVTYEDQIGYTFYKVEDSRKISWKLHPEYVTILDYKAQKATANFAGRHWTVYFTSQIPLQDGPYKFHGLPGLIIKAEDDTKSHSFQLKSIQNLTENFVYPVLHKPHPNTLSQKQYAKLFQQDRKDPTAGLSNEIPDQTDSEGNFRSSQQIIREIETHRKAAFKKDNNLIELDLLKGMK